MTAAAASSRRPFVVHPEAALLDPARHALALADAERRLGRALTDGERRIDLVRLDRDLASGKQRLVAAIETERRSAARRYARDAVAGRAPRMRLRLSRSIRSALRGLYDAGVQAGRGELRRAGYDPDALPRRLAAVPARLAVIESRVDHRLRDLGVADEHRLGVAFDLATASQSAILDAVRGLPGVRAIAADFTSVPAFAGLGSVWDQADAAGVTTAWTYTAVMDDGTCETCAGFDGETYESWEAIQEVLPDGGPNPDCDGGDRCRCRAVPEFGDQTGDGSGPGPSDGGPGPSFAPAPDWLGEQATSDLNALRGGVDEFGLPRSGYLTREQQQTRAAQEGNVAGFHPHYLPQSGYEAGDWATPAIQAQHEALLRVGRSIDDEVQARIEAATANADREIERLTRALDENRPKVMAEFERRDAVSARVYDELVAAMRGREATDEEWNALSNKLLADPRVQAADRALDAIQQQQFALNRERETHYAAVASAQKDVLLSTLSEIRSFGGEWTIGRATLDGADLLKDAARFYPTDWIVATDRIDVALSDERAFCRTTSDATRSLHYIQTHADDLGTAIHELGHTQEVRAAILDAERAFYDYRTTVGADGRTGAWAGEQQRVERMGGTYKDDEVTRPDEFFSRYVGKDYGGRNYELLTMGLQRLWTRGEIDAEYRAWLLGLLASL